MSPPRLRGRSRRARLAARIPLGLAAESSLGRRPWSYPPYARRALDLLLAVVSLPITVPLLAATALAIRIGSRGPVLFWQERVGQGGEPFHMAKFRSMHVGHEGRTSAVFADEDDDRVTPVGQFLRRSRLDELPQLWNVLKGEMSLVGSRPEQVQLADHFADTLILYPVRHRVPPGITGWAQVLQGYAATVDETRCDCCTAAGRSASFVDSCRAIRGVSALAPMATMAAITTAARWVCFLCQLATRSMLSSYQVFSASRLR